MRIQNKKRFNWLYIAVIIFVLILLLTLANNIKSAKTGFATTDELAELPTPNELYDDYERGEFCVEFKDLTYCYAILDSYIRDQFYNIYASEYNDVAVCDKITYANTIQV